MDRNNNQGYHKLDIRELYTSSGRGLQYCTTSALCQLDLLSSQYQSIKDQQIQLPHARPKHALHAPN